MLQRFGSRSLNAKHAAPAPAASKAMPSFLNADHVRKFYTLPFDQLAMARAGAAKIAAAVDKLDGMLAAMPDSIDGMSDEEVAALYDQWEAANNLAGTLAEFGQYEF